MISCKISRSLDHYVYVYIVSIRIGVHDLYNFLNLSRRTYNIILIDNSLFTRCAQRLEFKIVNFRFIFLLCVADMYSLPIDYCTPYYYIVVP